MGNWVMARMIEEWRADVAAMQEKGIVLPEFPPLEGLDELDDPAPTEERRNHSLGPSVSDNGVFPLSEGGPR